MALDMMSVRLVVMPDTTPEMMALVELPVVCELELCTLGRLKEPDANWLYKLYASIKELAITARPTARSIYPRLDMLTNT